MSLSAKLRRAPLRIASGAYLLNSGVTKLSADDETAKRMQELASGAYPVTDKLQPNVFVKTLGAAEIAVGGALLLPIVPPVAAGAALAGFSGLVLNMYVNSPQLHEGSSPRPTVEGATYVKDVALAGIGIGLIADATLEPAHDKVVELEATVAQKRVEKSRRARRKAKKATRKANSDYLKQLREGAVELQAEASKRAMKARKQARELADEYGPVAADKARSAREASRDLAEEYGPLAADKARSARDAAKSFADEYGPVAAEKARAARDAAKGLAEEYGPIAAEKARAARDAAKSFAEEYGPVAAEKARAAGAAARDLAEEYRPVAEKKAKQTRKAARKQTKVARKAAQEYAAKAQRVAAEARERIAS